ncbi:MAG TPA: glycosyltransferase [Saprospiraceae bacterium]|nr:glycosyltransferase [Saprospiraceae bacterium]
MKKIAIIGPNYPYRGGNSLFIGHLCIALQEKFELLIINYSLLYPEILFPGKTQYDKSNEVMDGIRQLKTHRILNSINPISWYNTAKKIKEFNPDLVVVDWWQPFFGPCHFGVLSLLGSSYKDRILFITENVISHESRFIDKILTKIGLAKASKFLVLSNKVQDDIKSLFPTKAIFKSELPIYDCYDNNKSLNKSELRSKFGFNNSDKVLLFFGYIRHYKGLDILIESLKILRSEDKSYKLLVAGESYENEEIYLDLISEYKLESAVHMENKFISNEDVGSYFYASDVAVLPYRSATQSGILNMAYGFNKPVVITNVGGLAEFVVEDQTGVIVNESSPDSIANGIKKFFQLNQTIDFHKNIEVYISGNSFSKIVVVFEEILH